MGTIAQELTRIQDAKSDLATSIANKGVTVPAATKIDGYAALVDQIQTGGGSLSINDASYLFYQGARLTDIATYLDAMGSFTTDAQYMFAEANSVTIPNNLMTKLSNANINYLFYNTKSITGILDLSNRTLNNPVNIVYYSRNDLTTQNFNNFSINLSNTILTGDVQNPFNGAYKSNSTDEGNWITVNNFDETKLQNLTCLKLFNRINFDKTTFDFSGLDLSNIDPLRGSLNLLELTNAKKITLPDLSDLNWSRNSTTYAGYAFKIFQGKRYVEEITLTGKYGYTGTNFFTATDIFSQFQSNVDKSKKIIIDLENFFTENEIHNINTNTASSGAFSDLNIQNGMSPRGVINLQYNYTVSNQTNIYPFGNSTMNQQNNICYFRTKTGNVIGGGAARNISFYMARLWRGGASEIPNNDVENKTNEDYFVDFLTNLGTNTSGYVRNLRINAELYDSVAQSTFDLATSKNYTLVRTTTY